MPFYEVITEPGNRSVMFAEDDDEALQALENHNARALKGEPGRGKSTARNDLGPDAPQVMDYPAERIKRVFVYDKHPADFNEEYTMSADVLRSELDNYLSTNEVVNLMELAAMIRDLADPHVDMENLGRHDSQYKMPETRELELPWSGNNA